MSEQAIYLDHAATTPLDPRVLEAMTPYLTDEFGNASSRQHPMGRAAAEAVERAREQVADLIGADPREIVFTSGATEANNLALKGVASARAYERDSKHYVTARSEHRAVLDPLRVLEEDHGFEVTRLGVDRQGAIDPAELERALTRRPRLVSLMHANNEIGTIHPLEQIGAACREYGALFHTDATQSVGKLKVDVEAMHIDLLSLSAHKFYGPKGVGALYLRRRGPRVRCTPIFDGGGHEAGHRSGTLNVPGIVGLGAAAEICDRELEREALRVAGLREQLENGLRERLEGVTRNGPEAPRLPGISNLAFAGIDAESLLGRLERVCASSSSACTSAQLQESHVLRALGADEGTISGSIRFSLGRSTTKSQIQRALEDIVASITVERFEGPRDLCQP